MKKSITLLSVVLTILVFGQGGYQDIVNKYSRFFGQHTPIYIVDDFTVENCGLSRAIDRKPDVVYSMASGCMTTYSNGYKKIEIKKGLSRDVFENTMLHEIYHYYFGDSEELASNFSSSFMNYVNNLK